MNLQFMKPAIVFFMFAFVAFSANAQFTETFEAQTPYVNTFNSNGQPFTLTNAFAIYSSRNGIGYQQSYRFIDNINNPVLNQVNAIKTTGATNFSVKNLWLFVATDAGNNPSTNGSLIISGKLAGAIVFTINKTTGFNGSFGVNDGFAFVNFTTEGGVDNSNFLIDEIEFQLQGNFNYLAIDNFTWNTELVVPVTLISYSATLQSSGKVSLNWKTSFENNSSHFIVERSADGRNFQQVAKIKAAGYRSISTTYNAFDDAPLDGLSYYRLVGYDLDGKLKQLGIKVIKNNSNSRSSKVYPNPATGSGITLKSTPASTANLYIIADMSGKIVKTGIIAGNQQQVNISQLVAGNYIMKLSDGQVIKWVKN